MDLAAKLKVPVVWPGHNVFITVLNPYFPLMVTVWPTGLSGAGGQTVLLLAQLLAGEQVRL